MDHVVSEPEDIVLKFAWTIKRFRDMSENWYDLTSREYDLFPGCCKFKFHIWGPLTRALIEDDFDDGYFPFDDGPINHRNYYNIGIDFFKSDGSSNYEFRIKEHTEKAHGILSSSWKIYDLLERKPNHQSKQSSIERFQWMAKQTEIDAYTDIKNNNGPLEFRAELKMTKINQNRLENLALNAESSRLALDFGHLLESNELCDFTIETSDESFKVHKAVLAARSPVFKAMLTANMKESNQSVLNLNHVESQSVKKFIEYIYTDKLKFDAAETAEGEINFKTRKNNIQQGIDLIRLADQCDLARLKGLCEFELNKSMCVKSVFEILKLADLHGIESLRSSTLKFIKFHRSSLADSKDLHAALDHSPELRKDILAALAGK